MEHLSIDIETYSDVDIKKCGVYRYVESDNFEILLFAYSVNGEEVKIIDLASGEKIPSSSSFASGSTISFPFWLGSVLRR